MYSYSNGSDCIVIVLLVIIFRILKKNKEQSENANSNSSCSDQTICHGQLKSQNSEFVYSNITNIVKDTNSSIHSPHNDHKYNKVKLLFYNNSV